MKRAMIKDYTDEPYPMIVKGHWYEVEEGKENLLSTTIRLLDVEIPGFPTCSLSLLVCRDDFEIIEYDNQPEGAN